MCPLCESVVDEEDPYVCPECGATLEYDYELVGERMVGSVSAKEPQS